MPKIAAARRRHPIGFLAVDEVSNDLECVPGSLAFVRKYPCIRKIAKERIQRCRRTGKQPDGVVEVVFHLDLDARYTGRASLGHIIANNRHGNYYILNADGTAAAPSACELRPQRGAAVRRDAPAAEASGSDATSRRKPLHRSGGVSTVAVARRLAQ